MNFKLPENTPLGQKNAIQADDKNITVSAGAGTGKTWVLSGRYARLLIENNDLKPSEILTLTYTEAAASDMKARIIERLEDELKDFKDENRKNEILDGLSDSWISTIHAFASRLIRESGLSLDIDPAATVISASQEQEFWEGIKNAVEFSNLRELARTYGNETLRNAAKSLDEDKFMTNAFNRWGAEKLSDFARAVSELQASSGRNWEEMLKWSDEDILITENGEKEKREKDKNYESPKQKIRKILNEEWNEVWEIFSAIVDLPIANNPDGPGGNLNKLLNWQKAHLPGNIEEKKFFYDSIVVDSEKKLSNGRGEPFTSLKDFLNGMTFSKWKQTRPEKLKEISPTFNQDFLQEELWMRRTLLKFCAVSWGMWNMMKERRGLLSFSDMILHALQAIENKSVKRNFKYILVDEFQDTDPLQFKMIEKLQEDLNSNLFAVGDPKQSIYKFRYADLKLFAQLMNDENFRQINLEKSFRTRESLLEKINKIFASLWRGGLGKDATMSRIKFNGLDAANINDSRNLGTIPDFKIILADNDKDLTSTRNFLAEKLAFYISKWVSEGRTVWDKKEKIIRPVKFSDFTVLSRTRKVYENLEAAFEKFNIPSVRDRSSEFFTRGEIGDIVCMLRAAADFEDSYSITGWLMSPFSGVPENEVLEKIFANANKKINFLELFKKNLPEAYSRLEYLSLIGNNEGASALLSVFDKDRRWLSCYEEKDRLRVLRNFRLALSMSRAFEQSGTSSLTALAGWLTRAVKREIKIEEPKWHDENENAVNLTAVHSSKGLEYPITIIFDTQKSKRPETNPLRPSKELGLVFTNFPEEFKVEDEPRLKNWESVLSEQGDLEEDQRLFYVAATRAQDSLIFCGMLNQKSGEPYKDSWTKFLLDNIDDEEKTKIEFADEIETPEIQEKIKLETEKENLTENKVIRVKNSLRQISASAFSLFEWCPFAWRRRYKQGLNLSWELTDRDFEADKNFIGGADLGSLAHWILAHWPKNENFKAELNYYLNDREMISRLPAQLREVWRDNSKKSVLREWLLKFAESEIGKFLINSKDAKREHRFMLRLDNQTVLAGAIDVIFENNLIDYKITSVNNAPAGLYESQLDFYAFIAHELTGFDEIKTTTAFLREGIFEERICSNFDEIKARILKASETCACGNLNPNLKHCAVCPFKKGCAFFNA